MQIYQAKDMSSWYQLIATAKHACGYDLSDGLDHYLVLTLQAFMENTDIADNVLAIEFLENVTQQSNHETTQNIRYVGDQCLLLSGLFPERAKKRNVSLSYYIDLGKNSYLHLANAGRHLKLNNELFFELGTHFVGLMDVLTVIRHSRNNS
jgi:hypothetical protein